MKPRSTNILPLTVTILAMMLGLFLVLSGCGRKTQPIPPETTLPKPIVDLRHQLDEKGVTLSWTAPSRTVKGEKLDRIDGFELLRAVVPEADYCEGCPVNFGRPIKIKTGKTQPGNIVHYHESVLRPGYRYIYKVRTKIGWLHAGADSNIVTLAWNTLISAPTSLTAAIVAGEVQLTWQKPRTLIDNTKLSEELQYRIFRSEANGEPAPIGPPVDKTAFTDVSVQKETRYTYFVQPLSKNSVGLKSGSVTVNVGDQAPPAPPTGVIAVQTKEGAKILWQQSSDSDLAGYHIYSRRKNEKKPTKIGEAGKGQVMFLDPAPLGPGIRYYSVSAFDDANPANVSEHSNETELIIK